MSGGDATVTLPLYFRAFNRCASHLLTILCYHRVFDPGQTGFQGYKPNLSASTIDFAAQMDLLREYYNPITLKDLVACQRGNQELPSKPVLVTFDDGYRDNGELAWPIMRQRGIVPAIFLATDYIGTNRAFIWDTVAFLFGKAELHEAEVPFLGRVDLDGVGARDVATCAWIDALKRRADVASADAIETLRAALGMTDTVAEATLSRCLDWNQVRTLAREGVMFGAHTGSHPILSNVPPAAAAIDIERSIEKITEETGSPPLGFAYPNGTVLDFTADHERIVAKTGVPLAFTLKPGPTGLSEMRQNPMAVRRIYVGPEDRGHRLLAKLVGAGRVAEGLRIIRGK